MDFVVHRNGDLGRAAQRRPSAPGSRANRMGRAELPHRAECGVLCIPEVVPRLQGRRFSASDARFFKKFLAKIDAEVPAELEVHLVCDNYSTHKSPTVSVMLEN